MPARVLDQQITLQRIVRTPDGIGGTEISWADLATDATVWADVRQGRGGSEGQIEGRMTATYPVLFYIHNRSDLSEADRVLFDGEAYNIRNIVRLGGRELYLKFEGERGVAS